MIDDEYLDPSELENDIKTPGKSPYEVSQEQFVDIYKRNLWLYLNSIEWDTWCKHETEEETKIRIDEHERRIHPFRKFF
jgi:hypothetical protein